MHEKNEIINSNDSKVVSEKESTLSILMQKVSGEGPITPTEKQVDEILSQRRQVHDMIHKDGIRESNDKKYYFTVIIIASCVVIVLVLFFAREFLTQVLSLIIGGLGGYGIGKNQQK